MSDGDEYTIRVEWTVDPDEYINEYHRDIEAAFIDEWLHSSIPGDTWTLLDPEGHPVKRLSDMGGEGDGS